MLAAFSLAAQQLTIVKTDDRDISNLQVTVSFSINNSFCKTSVHHAAFAGFITDDLVLSNDNEGKNVATLTPNEAPPLGPPTLVINGSGLSGVRDFRITLNFKVGPTMCVATYFVPDFTNVSLSLGAHGGSRVGKIWTGHFLKPLDYVARIYPSAILVNHFQGWGVSLCWWANVVGGYSNRDDYADLAFKTLKLNIVRYNIGGGENPNGPGSMEFRASLPGFEPANHVWNWDADQNQRWMLEAALARGVTRVEAFANSPPWWMTVSGSVTGGRGGTNNLQVSHEQDFAVYLAEVIKNLTQLDGVTFDAISPLNEPSAGWWTFGGHQEGCHIGPAQQNRVINLLHAELNKRGLHPLIDAPEDNDEQSGINSLMAYTAEGLENVGQISTHTYGANNPLGLKSLALSLRKPLRQTEYGDGDQTGMKLARRIHDDLVQLRPLSWCYWQVADYAGWGLLDNHLEENGGQTCAISRKFYTFEQFTRFLPPGCEIIGCSDGNSVVGYDSASGTLAIVTVNDSVINFTATFDLGNFAATDSTVECYRTSASESFKQLDPLAVRDRQFSSIIPARSVTTFVIQHVTIDQAPR
jgi:O-glycosyl hydrolase